MCDFILTPVTSCESFPCSVEHILQAQHFRDQASDFFLLDRDLGALFAAACRNVPHLRLAEPLVFQSPEPSSGKKYKQ